MTMKRLATVAIVAVLVLGCGGAKDAPPKPGGDGEGAKPPTGGTGEKTVSEKSEKVPFPERTLKEIRGSLASESTLSEDMMKRYMTYQARTAELRKAHKDDPKTMMEKLRELHKECGYRDSGHQMAEQVKVLRAMGVIGMMSSAELLLLSTTQGGPASGAIKDAWKKNAATSKKAAGDAKLSEADLRLAHKYMQRFANQASK
jgi:hypothetical protein